MALANVIRLLKNSMTLIWKDKGSKYPWSDHHAKPFAMSRASDDPLCLPDQAPSTAHRPWDNRPWLDCPQVCPGNQSTATSERKTDGESRKTRQVLNSFRHCFHVSLSLHSTFPPVMILGDDIGSLWKTCSGWLETGEGGVLGAGSRFPECGSISSNVKSMEPVN